MFDYKTEEKQPGSGGAGLYTEKVSMEKKSKTKTKQANNNNKILFASLITFLDEMNNERWLFIPSNIFLSLKYSIMRDMEMRNDKRNQ